ncbi:hypothetical protein OsJ_33388 [Oryza sativa Japonica Group]|uniref:TLDc domain-containing protein n=1 Tax=Oryza sativa subsp. japonica TaxID=39947 RepID=B9GA04_ORYSJ|nr:hypothetical protein OsJ_33388 [Oryza sativa Japonica Group]
MAAFMASGRSTVAPSTTRSCRPAAGFVTPRSLFSWGGRSAPPPEFQYHDVAPPFPMSLVANTHLRGKTQIIFAGRELKCCYKATVDGFSATDFHRRCDFKGPCVVVGRTGGGVRFGGFSPEGYRSTDDYYDTLDAFLFYWPETDTDAAAKEAAVVVLPKFGADGLLIGPPLTAVMGVFTGPDSSAGAGDLRGARSRLGLSYARRPDGKESLFGDESRAELDEVLVFCSSQIASLY